MSTEQPRFIAPDDCTSVYPIGSPPILPEEDDVVSEDPAPISLGATKPIIHPEITESFHSTPTPPQPVNPKVALAAAFGIAAVLAIGTTLFAGIVLYLSQP